MTINEKDIFPEVTLFKITDSGPTGIKSSDILNKKKILLVGVPGAFTPTCSEEHLPGYKKLINDFSAKGIDKIYFVSTNDPFVIKSWSDSHLVDGIDFLSDGNGELRDKSGLITDLSSAGLGNRFSRFAMLVENGIIKKLFNENGPGLDISKAENVLKSI